jgi:hypothetical protein
MHIGDAYHGWSPANAHCTLQNGADQRQHGCWGPADIGALSMAMQPMQAWAIDFTAIQPAAHDAPRTLQRPPTMQGADAEPSGPARYPGLDRSM